MTQDMLLAMPSVLPLNCTAGDPVESVTAHSQSPLHTRQSERLSCLYEVHMNRKRFLEEEKKKKNALKEQINSLSYGMENPNVIVCCLQHVKS